MSDRQAMLEREWTVAGDRVLLPATELDIGLLAHRNTNEFVAVELGMGADATAFTPSIVEHEKLRLGCKQRPDGSWRLSWRFRKEYLRDASAAAGQAVFEQEWLEAQQRYLAEPKLTLDVDLSIALMMPDQFRRDTPEGYSGGPSARRGLSRLQDGRVGVGPEFWALHQHDRRSFLWDWLAPRQGGRVKVWVQPDDMAPAFPLGAESVERAFAVGADVSAGVAQSDSAAVVLVSDTHEQAAEFACNTIQPADFGRLLAGLGRYYHDALVCPVQKMHGLTVLRALIDDAGYGYVWHDRQTTGMAERRTEQCGWPKGEASDPLLFGRYVDAVQYGRVILHSVTTWRQHQQYIYDEMGRITHQSLADQPTEVRHRHGDLVIASALAWRALLDVPAFTRVKPHDFAPKGSLNWRDEVWAEQQRRRGAGAVRWQ